MKSIKESVEEMYLRVLEEKLSKARNSYEIARNDTIEAEGRMVTRYDSTKTETAWLADGYLKDVNEITQCIDDIKKEMEITNIADTVWVDLLENGEYQGEEKITLSIVESQEPQNKLVAELVGCKIGDVIQVKHEKNLFGYQIKRIDKGDNTDCIAIGSIVTLEDEYGDMEKYYIVNQIGGIELKIGTEEFFCISKQTPIAKALLGKKMGDTVAVDLKETILFKVVGLE